jgi:hypothetical protein
MSTTVANIKRNGTVGNFKSTGGKVSVKDEFSMTDAAEFLSAVLRNSNNTPYVWMNVGDDTYMVYMSKKASALAEELNDQLSKSKHAIQVWEAPIKDADGAVVKDENGDVKYQENYIVTLVNEVIELKAAVFAD